MNALSSRVLRLLLVAGAVLVGAAGASYATTLATRDASTNVIHGCYLDRIGTLRIIDPGTQHCLAIETPIQWNQSGPPGPKGDPGVVASLDALNGVPCTVRGLAGQTMIATTTNVGGSQLAVACAARDPREPNDTRATEAAWSGQGEASLYPAGDEDWYTVSGFFIGGSVFMISVNQERTAADSVFNAPIHIEVYENGGLVASGDTSLSYQNPSPASGQTFEVHISGTGPALYLMNVM